MIVEIVLESLQNLSFAIFICNLSAIKRSKKNSLSLEIQKNKRIVRSNNLF